jgi:hypothetical protein
MAVVQPSTSAVLVAPSLSLRDPTAFFFSSFEIEYDPDLG